MSPKRPNRVPRASMFATALKELRLANGETLEQFGARMGRTKTYYHHLESGRVPVSVKKAATVARALGQPVGRFVAYALNDKLEAAGLDYIVTVHGEEQ